MSVNTSSATLSPLSLEMSGHPGNNHSTKGELGLELGAMCLDPSDCLDVVGCHIINDCSRLSVVEESTYLKTKETLIRVHVPGEAAVASTDQIYGGYRTGEAECPAA